MDSRITILGLGPGGIDLLPLKNWEVLQSGEKIFLRTEHHPAAQDIINKGIMVEKLDKFYEASSSFEECYAKVAETIISESAMGPLIYAVPGNPLVAEDTVRIIMAEGEKRGIAINILGAMSFLDVLFPVLNIDPIHGLKIIDGLQLGKISPSSDSGNIITQVYNPMIASEVKLSLMDYYPDDKAIIVVSSAGIPNQEKVARIPLYELDRLQWVNHLTSVYIPPGGLKSDYSRYPLDPLIDTLAILRGPKGCPWDKEQTHKSLKPYLVEETYEVLDALDNGIMKKVCEELGDLLLQIGLHAQIAAENEYFDINDVILEITHKMIRRHPHVFGQVKVEGSDDVTVNWDRIKAEEKAKAGEEEQSIMAEITSGLPALVKAEKIQKKAAKVGFDWPDYQGPLQKVHEELQEINSAIEGGNKEEIRNEIGDLFFALINLCRHLGIDAETSLSGTNHKFMERFNYIEEELRKEGKSFANANLEELDVIWEKSKRGKVAQIVKKV